MQATEWKKNILYILEYIYMIKDLYPEYVKNFYKSEKHGHADRKMVEITWIAFQKRGYPYKQ